MQKMQHRVSGMVESAVDKTLRSLQNCKQHNGIWLNKYTALAAEIGINSDLAEKDATTFDRDLRVKLLDTLTANINKRYNANYYIHQNGRLHFILTTHSFLQQWY